MGPHQFINDPLYWISDAVLALRPICPSVEVHWFQINRKVERRHKANDPDVMCLIKLKLDIMSGILPFNLECSQLFQGTSSPEYASCYSYLS